MFKHVDNYVDKSKNGGYPNLRMGDMGKALLL